jgi:cadmium resistance protein CadD (predicted permease)
VDLGLIGQAVVMFAATNVDDIVLLALFLGQAAGHRGGAARVVAGQYLGFAAILAASIRAAWRAWRERHHPPDDEPAAATGNGPAVFAVAAVTFANGGDNIGVYVPVFATAGTGGLIVFVVVFLALVAVWCLLGRLVVSHPGIARALARWGHILLPIVLIGIGLLILIEGHAFGL